MSSQLLRTITKGSGGQCTIELARTVLSQGYTRVVDAIDPQVKQDVAQKTEAALQAPGVVPEDIKAKMNKVVLTSTWHPSPLDPKPHASGVVYDDQEVELAKIHVAQNPSEQERVR